MAVMERDLRLQAEVFVDQTFQGRLAEGDRVALEKWLKDQIEQERQGWKKKVQMSLKEVEKERKLALDVHGAVHRLNDQFKPLLQSILLFREPSLYSGADDKDAKVSHVHQLEKNLDAILTMLARYQNERMSCFDLLKLEYDDQTSLVQLLDGRLRPDEIVTKDVEKSAKETEARLLKEIQLLNDTLELQDTRLQQIEQKHRRELEDMSMIHKEMKTKLLIKSAITSSSKSCQTELDSKDVGVQVRSVVVESPRVVKQTKNKGIQVRVRDKSDKSISFLEQYSSRSSKSDPQASPRDAESKSGPITSVTIVKSPQVTNSFQSPTDILKSFDILHKDFISKTRDDRLRDSPRGRHQRDQQTVDYLRGQVLEYTNKLQSAQAQMEGYQQQLAKLRASKNRSDLAKENGANNNEANHEARAALVEATNGLGDAKVAGGRKWASEGFLAGRNVSDKDEPTTRRELRASSTAMCLRCNRTYKKKSNNPKACRYHPKPKQTVEKYDSSGKLIRMVHVWGCCNAKPDSYGCQMGAHV